jgi:hypothetical protein
MLLGGPIQSPASSAFHVPSNIMQFSMDISVMDTGKHRKLVLTGVFSRPWWGCSGLERIYVVGLKITYLLMYL